MRDKPHHHRENGPGGGVGAADRVGVEVREQALLALADSQHANVTSAQLHGLGIDRRAVDRRVRSGRLHPKHRGVYRLGRADAPHLGDEHAAVLACGDGSAIGLRSAAWVLRLIRSRPDLVEVCVPRGRTPRHAGIRVCRASDLTPADVTLIERIPVTSALRTLLDLASFAARSPRSVSPDTVEAATAEALHRRLVTSGQLRAALDLHSGRPGAPLLRRLCSPATPPARTRSEAERRLLRLIRAAGLPQPEANVLEGRYEVDLLWRERRLIVEIDGFEFHGDRRSFEADRARDAHLQAAGWRVMRVTWRQITQTPAAVVANLAASLAKG